MYISCYNLIPSLKESLNNYCTYNNKIDYLEDLKKLFGLLESFIKNKGKIIPRSEIIKELYPKYNEVDGRRVDTLIK